MSRHDVAPRGPVKTAAVLCAHPPSTTRTIARHTSSGAASSAVGARASAQSVPNVPSNLFRHSEARYKGLARNETQLFSLFGFIAKRRHINCAAGCNSLLRRAAFSMRS